MSPIEINEIHEEEIEMTIDSTIESEEENVTSDDCQSDISSDEDRLTETERWTDIVKPVVADQSHKLVLVTGGAGFIGSKVAQLLLERGDDVVIVDEMNDYYDVRIKRDAVRFLTENWGPERLRFYEGDICDTPFITGVFERERPRWIVHMAARAGVRPSIQDPFIYVRSNIDGTTRLMELARNYKNCNFVFASSSSVYGGSTKAVFSEDDVVDNPASPYAASKKACELMAYPHHHL